MGNLDPGVEYIAIIRRAEFVDLFKYGWLCLPHSVRLDKSMQAGEDRETFDELVRWMPAYEYSFEYLLICFLGSEEDILVRKVAIEQVQAVYALDERARHELSISFDPRIKIQVSVWEKWFLEQRRQSFLAQCELGVTALWRLFGLSDDDKRVCEETITQEIRAQIFNLIFTGGRPSGDLSAWVYLFLYERHAYYPKDKNIGYFLDYIHVFLNSHQKRELDTDVTEEDVNAIPLLQTAQSDRFKDLYKSIEGSDLQKKAQVIDPSFHYTAPLFLYLKNRCAEGFDKKLLEYESKKSLTNETPNKLALYLLGLALGYDKVYDAYYDEQPLSIFSDKPKSRPSKKRSVAPSPALPDKKPIAATKEATSKDDEAGRKTAPEVFPIAWMKPRDERLGRHTPILPAYTEEQRQELEETGLRDVQYTSLRKEQFKCKCVEVALQAQGYKAQSERMRLFPFAKQYASKLEANHEDSLFP